VEPKTIPELSNENELLEKKIASLQKTVFKYRRAYENALMRLKFFHKTRTSLCNHTVLKKQKSKPNEIQIVENTKCQWTKKDIVKSLRPKSMSLKAYETARIKLGVPLPSPKTLRRHASNFPCHPGLSFKIIEIMREYGANLNTVDRICGLCFDEMSLDAREVGDKL